MRNWLPSYSYSTYTRIRHTGMLRASPPTVLVIGFLVLILAGTILLSLPISAREPISVFSAFFMATSAVTITGLAVIEPGEVLTQFGQTVLILLVQLGGLGFVTFAVLSAITLGKRMSLQHQALALQAFNQTSVTKIRGTAFTVLKISLTIELCAALVFCLWWMGEYPPPELIHRAIFHAVSAFNNSGFSLFPGSLAPFVSDPVTVLTVTTCIILGGVGFTVIADLRQKKAWAPLMPYTKVVLLATLGLNVLGFTMIWLLEVNNPNTLGDQTPGTQVLSAWMLSVTSRTAGFATLDISYLHDSTTLVIMLLMFIGGGSLSTAGGIKIGAFVVLLAAVYSYIRHKKEVVLYKRSISSDTVQKSLALLLVTVALVLGGVLLIPIFEQERTPFVSILFEVVSAVSTTGLSRNTTPELSVPSQAVLTLLMFAGRLGPLTLVYSLATQKRSRVRYPETEFQVG